MRDGEPEREELVHATDECMCDKGVIGEEVEHVRVKSTRMRQSRRKYDQGNGAHRPEINACDMNQAHSRVHCFHLAFRANAWPYRHARLHRQSWSSVSVRICLKWGRLAPIISSVRLKVTFPSVARRRFFSTPVERCVVREQWQTSSSFPSLPRQI